MQASLSILFMQLIQVSRCTTLLARGVSCLCSSSFLPSHTFIILKNNVPSRQAAMANGNFKYFKPQGLFQIIKTSNTGERAGLHHGKYPQGSFSACSTNDTGNVYGIGVRP